MDRKCAERIRDRLLDAFEALYKTEMAIAWLGKEEQYPDLTPSEEEEKPPILCSELTWSEVNLPSSVTENQFDEILVSLLLPDWRKTSMFLFNAEKRFKELGWTISDEAIVARLQVLSDQDRIESVGDLRYWFNSEVRLKD